jgi:hypothetical protein
MAAQNTLIPLDTARRHRTTHVTGLFTIKEVSQACGLPGPVIMQLVPRTWVEPVGWLYTFDQISAAITISEDLRRPSGTNQLKAQREPIQMLECQRCAALTTVDDAAARGWLNVVDPNSSGPAAWDGKDYCSHCATRCPSCRTDDDRLCGSCLGTRRVPRPPLSTNFVQSTPLRRRYL